MRNIFIKEIRLAASPLSFFFILFGAMFFLPGYPVLCGAFFVSLGIYQSFRSMNETNDIVFSALLPIAKRDTVKGKYLFVCFIELCSLALMAAAMLVRMTVLSDSPVYRSNALMNANPFALGMAFVIFALFNLIFVCGFFKTAYKTGRPFILFIVAAFTVIFIAEALHYIPSLAFLNAFGFESCAAQLALLAAGVIIYAALTAAAYKISCKRFERTDL